MVKMYNTDVETNELKEVNEYINIGIEKFKNTEFIGRKNEFRNM